MFSGLSKLADKSFILGYFIPALFGLAAIIVANQDLPLFQEWLSAATHAEKGLGNVVATLFVIWALSVFLMAMNLHIFKIFEGYYWPFNLPYFQKRQVKRCKKAWEPFDQELDKLRGLQKEISDLAAKDPTVDDNATKLAIKRQDEKTRRLNAAKLQSTLSREYLRDEQFILGTRLGNVIRCFENYPAKMYDASSVVLWPRMADVISKEYLEVISEARAEVDMYLSFTVVLLGLTLFTVIRALFPDLFDVAPPSHDAIALNIVVTLLLAKGSYLAAVRSAKNWWGETYRGAYDLYLDALAKKLGYTLPADPEKRREFWRMISNRFRYFAQFDLPDLRTPPGESTEATASHRANEGEARTTAEEVDEDEDEDQENEDVKDDQ